MTDPCRGAMPRPVCDSLARVVWRRSADTNDEAPPWQLALRMLRQLQVHVVVMEVALKHGITDTNAHGNFLALSLREVSRSIHRVSANKK